MHGSPPQHESQRSLLRFFMGGSVDDGKSTLIGRLLHETDAVAEDELAALKRDSARFSASGQPLDFSLLVDGLEDEREQGITIDVAHRYFATANRAFIVADTPGHESYTRNTASGPPTAALAIVLVAARGTSAPNPAPRRDRPFGRRPSFRAGGQQARFGRLGPRGFRQYSRRLSRFYPIARIRLADAHSPVRSSGRQCFLAQHQHPMVRGSDPPFAP